MTKTRKATLNELLTAHPVFGELDRKFLDEMLASAWYFTARDGGYLFRTGENKAYLYLITKGEVDLEYTDETGKHVIYQRVGPGGLLGLSWLVPPYLWRFDAHAVGEVEAVEFTAEHMRAVCEDDPAMGFAVLKAFTRPLVERFYAARGAVAEKALADA